MATDEKNRDKESVYNDIKVTKNNLLEHGQNNICGKQNCDNASDILTEEQSLVA
jgi:hypothetical protein|tara:strand:- start:163 stop:324 length:162 start_codon:yes stop_codon:yes gene_type:complete